MNIGPLALIAIVLASSFVGALFGAFLPIYLRHRSRVLKARAHFKVRDLRR